MLNLVWDWMRGFARTMVQDMSEGVAHLKQILENKKQARKDARLARAEKFKALTVIPLFRGKSGQDDVGPDLGEKNASFDPEPKVDVIHDESENACTSFRQRLFAQEKIQARTVLWADHRGDENR